MSDTPRTDRLLDFIERDKKDIWQALAAITDWARGLERESASLDLQLSAVPEAAHTDLLRRLRDFVTGDLKLPCMPSETDRECYNRCRDFLIREVDSVLGPQKERKS